MTAKTKDQIKAFFQTGDKPTEAQFIDAIDSWVDKAGPIGDIETAASAGTTGIVFCSGGNGEIINPSTGRSFLGITVYTTAGVQQAAQAGTSFTSADAVAACADFYTTTAQASAVASDIVNSKVATTAQASALASNSVFMTPILVKKATEPRSTDITDLPTVTIASADSVAFSDSTDSGNIKQGTIQDILDLKQLSVPTTYQAVGTYGIFQKITGTVGAGSTTAGSTLGPTYFSAASPPVLTQSGSSPSGTWRNMGAAINNTSDYGLFVRTA